MIKTVSQLLDGVRSSPLYAGLQPIVEMPDGTEMKCVIKTTEKIYATSDKPLGKHALVLRLAPQESNS